MLIYCNSNTSPFQIARTEIICRWACSSIPLLHISLALNSLIFTCEVCEYRVPSYLILAYPYVFHINSLIYFLTSILFLLFLCLQALTPLIPKVNVFEFSKQFGNSREVYKYSHISIPNALILIGNRIVTDKLSGRV